MRCIHLLSCAAKSSLLDIRGDAPSRVATYIKGNQGAETYHQVCNHKLLLENTS